MWSCTVEICDNFIQKLKAIKKRICRSFLSLHDCELNSKIRWDFSNQIVYCSHWITQAHYQTPFYFMIHCKQSMLIFWVFLSQIKFQIQKVQIESSNIPNNIFSFTNLLKSYQYFIKLTFFACVLSPEICMTTFFGVFQPEDLRWRILKG